MRKKKDLAPDLTSGPGEDEVSSPLAGTREISRWDDLVEPSRAS